MMFRLRGSQIDPACQCSHALGGLVRVGVAEPDQAGEDLSPYQIPERAGNHVELQRCPLPLAAVVGVAEPDNTSASDLTIPLSEVAGMNGEDRPFGSRLRTNSPLLVLIKSGVRAVNSHSIRPESPCQRWW